MEARRFADEGWSYKISLWGSSYPGITVLQGAEDAGLVLYDVSHEGHYLADSVRVAAIWINAGTEYEKHLKLGPADFELYNDLAKRPDEKADLNPRMRPPYQFADYPTVAYIQAQFITHDALFPSGNKLLVTVRYILTKYSLTPAHEPGGLLSAARLFPLVTHALIDSNGQATEDPDFRSVRFDYRINYSLDVFLSAPDPKTFKAGTRQLSTKEWIAILHKPQQAGLFRDSEVLDYPPEKNFYAVEKPLVYEVVGHGLNDGVPGSIGPEGPDNSTQVIHRTTWDNIHWWGGYRQLHVPSAPGAFHAAHLHWRWGQAEQHSDPITSRVLPEIGKPQFIGGHGLVDPKLPNQTIIVAVCLKDSIKDTKADFEESFTLGADGKVRIPEKIEDGARIELWYSTEIRPSLLYPSNEGCVFIHGFFFAHDPEPTLLGNPFVFIKTGPEEPQYVPTKPNKPAWIRNPKD